MASASSSQLVVGTRKSNLALIQTHYVADLLAGVNPGTTFPVLDMTTVGDRNQTTPLHLLSPYNSKQPAKSLWTDELESALLDGRMDLLVHSCKDVPTVLRDGCEIAALLERHDPRDALVIKKGLQYKSLDELPAGSVVGTGSVRRVAQLSRAYPKLKFADMRGNLNTRLNKLDAPESPYAALILAVSGMTRLGVADRITAALGSPALMHAVGQGALAVEIRSGDAKARAALTPLGHWQTEWRVAAERGLLRELEGGCSVPVGVESSVEEITSDEKPHYPANAFEPLEASTPTLHFSGLVEGSFPSSSTEMPTLRERKARLDLQACVTSTDGQKHVVYAPGPVVVTSFREAKRWGEDCAKQLRTLGAGAILDEINAERQAREDETLAQSIQAQAEHVEVPVQLSA